jgi:autotransporter-associated beta strand protein
MALYTSTGTNASASPAGTIDFHDNSGAGSATFVTTPGTASLASGGFIRFFNRSTADHASFTNKAGTSFGAFGSFGGATSFFDTAGAVEASFTNNGGAGGAPGQTVFVGNSSADHATFVNNPATKHGDGGISLFSDTSSARSATFTNNGSAVSGAAGGRAFFNAAASAGKAIFVNQGAVGVTSLFAGARTEFVDSATAARSTLTANGGTNGGVGAVIHFGGDSDGGKARVILAGNGSLDISDHNSPGLTIGSVEGDGNVFLGGLQLSIGANSLNTTLSGLIQDGGEHGGTGGSILKLGPGSLTLTNANTYTGGTIVTEGSLVVRSGAGSATGTGAVQVNEGSLAGGGSITGEVTIGTGSGTGATLAPSAGTHRRTTLRLQSSLTFKGDATYASRLYPQSGKADQVTTRGVTIEDGAEFSFVGDGSTIIAPGTIFYLIKNTAATPIAGNFSNLVDGSTVEHAGNNFQVSYEGGDGNDLTLTVVP